MTGSYISAATNIIGGVLRSYAAAEAQQAALAEFRQELARQAGYANEAMGSWRGSLAGASAEAARTQMDQGRNERLQQFAQLSNVHLTPGGFNEMNRVDRGRLGVTTQARANLGSYSDWALQQTIRDIKTQHEINRIVNFAGGTAGVFPYKQDAALHSMDWLDALGQSIQALGGTASTAYEAYRGRPRTPRGGSSSQGLYDAPGGYGDQYANIG